MDKIWLFFWIGIIIYLIGFFIIPYSIIGFVLVILGIFLMILALIPILINVKNVIILKKRNLKAMNEILQRFAKGEITKEEFEEIKKKF